MAAQLFSVNTKNPLVPTGSPVPQPRLAFSSIPSWKVALRLASGLAWKRDGHSGKTARSEDRSGTILQVDHSRSVSC